MQMIEMKLKLKLILYSKEKVPFIHNKVCLVELYYYVLVNRQILNI